MAIIIYLVTVLMERTTRSHFPEISMFSVSSKSQNIVWVLLYAFRSRAKP